jgi:hypothetical protein
MYTITHKPGSMGAVRDCLPDSIRELCGGAGGSRKVNVRFTNPRTSSKNQLPILAMQAYIA